MSVSYFVLLGLLARFCSFHVIFTSLPKIFTTALFIYTYICGLIPTLSHIKFHHSKELIGTYTCIPTLWCGSFIHLFISTIFFYKSLRNPLFWPPLTHMWLVYEYHCKMAILWVPWSMASSCKAHLCSQEPCIMLYVFHINYFRVTLQQSLYVLSSAMRMVGTLTSLKAFNMICL